MSYNSWNQSLITAQTPGAALANSTLATSLLPPAARFTLPANLLNIGTKFRIRCSGVVSTVVSAPGNLAFNVLFGSATVFGSGPIALNTTAVTNQTFDYESDITCRSIGNQQNATMLGTGKFSGRATVGAAANGVGGSGGMLIPDTNPTVGTGFDSTVSVVIDLLGQFSVANPSNSIQLLQYELILCN
jgi:hypothetical protein